MELKSILYQHLPRLPSTCSCPFPPSNQLLPNMSTGPYQKPLLISPCTLIPQPYSRTCVEIYELLLPHSSSPSSFQGLCLLPLWCQPANSGTLQMLFCQLCHPPLGRPPTFSACGPLESVCSPIAFVLVWSSVCVCLSNACPSPTCLYCVQGQSCLCLVTLL